MLLYAAHLCSPREILSVLSDILNDQIHSEEENEKFSYSERKTDSLQNFLNASPLYHERFYAVVCTMGGIGMNSITINQYAIFFLLKTH